jgi:HK97 family phage major capsid protein
VADRQRLSVQVLRERYADTDQVGVVLINRVGGALANPDAVRVGIV